MLIDVEDVALGHESKMRWNNRGEWVWSDRPTHEALVAVEQFDAQLMFQGAQRAHVRREKTIRGPYVLRACTNDCVGGGLEPPAFDVVECRRVRKASVTRAFWNAPRVRVLANDA